MSAALEVEVIGLDQTAVGLDRREVEQLCHATLASMGAGDGHLAVQFVDAARIAALNARHRGKPEPTDVLSFPIDELQAEDGVEHEYGDVVICPQHTVDLREAIVHGVLHLLGMDHETDEGEMLAAQAAILASVPGGPR